MHTHISLSDSFRSSSASVKLLRQPLRQQRSLARVNSYRPPNRSVAQLAPRGRSKRIGSCANGSGLVQVDFGGARTPVLLTQIRPGTARNRQQLDGFFLGGRRWPQEVAQDCACRATSYTCIMRGPSDKGRIHPVSSLPAVVGIEERASVSAGDNNSGSTPKAFASNALQPSKASTSERIYLARIVDRRRDHWPPAGVDRSRVYND